MKLVITLTFLITIFLSSCEKETLLIKETPIEETYLVSWNYLNSEQIIYLYNDVYTIFYTFQNQRFAHPFIDGDSVYIKSDRLQLNSKYGIKIKNSNEIVIRVDKPKQEGIVLVDTIDTGILYIK